MRKRAVSFQIAVAITCLLALPITVPVSAQLGDVVFENHIPGTWVSSGSSSCGASRVCADWIDDRFGLMGSCCIPGYVLDTRDPEWLCSSVLDRYALYSINPFEDWRPDDEG